MYHLPMTAWRLSYSRRRPEPFICVMISPLDHLFLIWTKPQTRNRKPIKTDAIIPAGLSENSGPLFTNRDCITEKTLLEICIIIVILMSPVRVRSEPRINPIHIALANCTGLRWETANKQESWHCLRFGSVPQPSLVPMYSVQSGEIGKKGRGVPCTGQFLSWLKTGPSASRP